MLGNGLGKSASDHCGCYRLQMVELKRAGRFIQPLSNVATDRFIFKALLGRMSSSIHAQEVQPLATHIVVGDDLFASSARQQVGTRLDRALRGLRHLRIEALLETRKLIEQRAVRRAAGIEYRLAVDAIVFERAAPAAEIPRNRLVGNHHVIVKARAVGESETAGTLHAS